MNFLILFAAALLLIASLTPYINVSRQETDLPSHFVLQYFIGALGLAAVAAIFDAPGFSFALIFGALLANLMQLMPLFRFGRNDLHPDTGKTLKILQVNVLKLNGDASRLKTLIEKEQPDIVVGAEIRDAFVQMFRSLSFSYPHQMVEPRDKSSYGMAVLSKLPFTAYAQLSLDRPDNVAMAFTVRHEGREIEFLSMHPATPNRDIGSRDREFENASQHFGNRRGNIVVLGDLNATPYCPALKKLCRVLNLKNAREGHGVAGSFPVFFPFWWLHLPIDHVLVGENLHADGFRLGPDIGSDHFPTITTISHVNH